MMLQWGRKTLGSAQYCKHDLRPNQHLHRFHLKTNHSVEGHRGPTNVGLYKSTFYIETAKSLKQENNQLKFMHSIHQATTMPNKNMQYVFINKNTLLMINPIK